MGQLAKIYDTNMTVISKQKKKKKHRTELLQHGK